MRITPENITELKPNEVIVVPTNLSGIHGAGLAKFVYKQKWGLVWGQGVGLMGRTYGLPTKDHNIKTLPIQHIQDYVDDFVHWASYHTKNTFLVTEIGCGLAGYKPSDIAPLFKDCLDLENVYLPKSFWEVLKEKYGHDYI